MNPDTVINIIQTSWLVMVILGLTIRLGPSNPPLWYKSATMLTFGLSVITSIIFTLVFIWS